MRAPRISKQRKSRWRAGALEQFREALLRKRRELVGDSATLRDEALRAGNPDEAGASHSMPHHMAELASDAWEQEFALSLVQDRQTLLREIDDALQRIRDRTYGVCEVTGVPIPKARLKAIPWTRYCIGYALKLEAG